MPAYADAYGVEVNLLGSGSWTDITAYITSDIAGFYGAQKQTPDSRVDDVGTLTFTLLNRNSNGYFVPGNPACLSGWGIGVSVRFYITYNAVKTIKWYGHIYLDGLKINNNLFQPITVDVTAKNWFFFASNYRLINQTIQTNKTCAQATASILGETPEQPLAVSYGTMYYTFPSVFDSLQVNTTALSEIAKDAISEMGYAYMTSAGLTIDGRYDRENRTYPTIAGSPTVQESYSDILDQNGGLILDQNGNNLVGATVASSYADQHFNTSEVFGQSLVNLSKTTITPRQTDATNVQVYKLPSSVMLTGHGSTIVTGKFIDPNQNAQTVSVVSCTTPAASTDWLVNTASNGSGANVTGNITMTFSYVASQFTATFVNPGANAYLIKFNVNGEGVYLYTQLIVTAQNNASITSYGQSELDLTLTYQTDYSTAFLIATSLIDIASVPTYEIQSADYHANWSAGLMNLFIYGEPGMRFLFTQTKNGINADHFITGIGWTVHLGGIIDFTFYLRNAVYVNAGV